MTATAPSVRLKPCPFCGSSEVICSNRGDDDFAVTCKSCWATSPFGDSREFAMTAWNTRATLSQPADARERIARIIDPEAHEAYDSAYRLKHQTAQMQWITRVNVSRAKADAIIAAGLVADEPVKNDPLEDLVTRFSAALLEKLKAAREKYGYRGELWRESDWEQDCQQGLLNHLAKGDPRDVAAYCAFMWYHGWSTVAPDDDELHGCREALRKAAIQNAKNEANISDLNDMVLRYMHRAKSSEAQNRAEWHTTGWVRARNSGRILLVWREFAGVREHVELGYYSDSKAAWVNTYDHPFHGDPDGWAPLLPFKNESTIRADERERCAKPDLLAAMEQECWTLRCIDVPTGGGDADVAWEVVQHHMANPRDRVIASGKTPEQALTAALERTAS